MHVATLNGVERLKGRTRSRVGKSALRLRLMHLPLEESSRVSSTPLVSLSEAERERGSSLLVAFGLKSYRTTSLSSSVVCYPCLSLGCLVVCSAHAKRDTHTLCLSGDFAPVVVVSFLQA